MKKINLIEWLWKTDSHEKQKPQRFGRYAAILIMLLTLGVGQMWGAWTGNAGICVNGTWYKASSDIDGGNWLSGKTTFNGTNLGAITSLELGGEYQNWDDSKDDACNWNSNNGIWITITTNSGTSVDAFKLSCYRDGKSGNNNVWKTTGSTGTCGDGSSWAAYAVDISGYAAGVYKLKVHWFSASGVALPSSGDDVATFTINPVVTFKANGGTGSDYTQRVTYNTNTALTANTFTKTGYNFAGWATSSDGDVVYANKANVKLTAHTNLFAKWTAKTTTVTLNANAPAGQTVTGGGTTVTATYDSALPSFTALTCNGGYSLTGYWTSASGGSATKVINANGSFNGNNGIWNRTDGATLNLYARWSADPGVSLVASKTSGINVGETITLTATGSNASNITKYDFYEGSTKVHTATTSSGTASYSYTPSAAGDKTMKVIMTYNSGSSTVTSSNVALSLNTPSVGSLTEASSTTEMWLGVNPTGNLTFTAASSNVSSGASVTWSISDATGGTFTQTGAGSYSGKSWTYTPASTGSKTITVTMTIGGNNYTRTYNLKVYERWNIYVQNNCGWENGIALYYYGDITPAAWPGVQGSGTGCEEYAPGKRWYKVTLDSKYDKFILDNNDSGGSTEEKLVDNVAVNKATYGADTYWDFKYKNGSGPKYYTLRSISPSKPTVSITSYEVISCTQIKLTGTISNYGSDGSTEASHLKEVGFYCGETKYSTTHTSGSTFTKVITGLTAGTEYTFKAYAVNVKGEGKQASGTNVTTRAGGTYTIKVRTTVGANAPKIYAWTAADANDGVLEKNANYGSGVAMTAAITGTVYKWWSYDVDKTYNNYIIYETGDANKTNDITAPQAATCYWYNSANAQASRYGTMDCPHTTPQLYIETTAGNEDYDYHEMTNTSGTLSKSLTLAAKSTYKFKIFYNGEYFGKSGKATRASNTVDDLSASVETYVQVETDAAGSYTFEFTTGGKDLTVRYPAAHKITYGIGNINGSNSDIGATSTPSFTSGDYVLDATAVTFTKGTTKNGYHWEGWWNNKNATGTCHSSADDSWTSAASTRSADLKVYACYSYNNYTITYHLDGGTNHEDNPSGFTVVTPTITLKAPSKTGYNFVGWYTNEGMTISGNTIPVGTYANKEFWAKWTPKNYTITLNQNGATTESDPTSLTATYDAKANGASDVFTLDNPERTGYTFRGWNTEADTSGTIIVTWAKYYEWSTAYVDRTGHWVHDGDVEVFAMWKSNTYTVTLSCSDETGYGSAGGDVKTSVTATYDATMPSMGTAPTPLPGYKFQGYFTGHNGGGTQYYDASGNSVNNWNIAGNTTLYAYFQKTVISSLEHPAAVAKGDVITVDVNPVFNQEDAQPNMAICWSLLYDNDNPVESGVAVADNPAEGKPNQVRFTLTGISSGYYKIKAVLKANGSTPFSPCSDGTELSTIKSNIRIAGNSTVTIQYEDASGNKIAANTSVEVARGDSIGIKAPNIIGYSFTGWTLGDVLHNTCKDDATCDTDQDSINIKADYDGYLTASYEKKQMIYFNNTLGWDTVFVYFYNNGSYWGSSQGTGADASYFSGAYTGKHGGMTKIEGTNIYYFDLEANSVSTSYTNVAFTEVDQHGYGYFSLNNVIKLSDYSATLSMYVPLTGETPEEKNTPDYTSNYYWKGYWLNYPESTGYELKIYDNTGDGASLVKERKFEFPADKAMPMSITVDLEGGKTYGFKIYRIDGTWFRNGGTMTNGHSGDTGQADWEFGIESGTNCGLTTTSAGDYTFTLRYKLNGMHKVGVHYPESSGDFRVLYTDDARIAKHDATENKSWLLSSVIPSNTERDTISYFVRAENSKHPKIKIQKCTVSDEESEEDRKVSWADQGTAINIPDSITRDSVYNFIFTKSAGNLVLEAIKPYTGNYYIRVDGAGSSNWDDFRAADHLMPYSDYSFHQTTDPYSHYFTHWYKVVKEGGDVKVKNIKFVVANDYSVCVSDTIVKDGIADDYVDANGYLTRSANIRFMYNCKTNVATRRYVDGAQEVNSTFLMILSDDSKIYDSQTGGSVISELTFSDKGNWIYEANVYALPTATYKLRSKFGENATGDASVDWDKKGVINQYFKGGPSSTEQLIGGDPASTTRMKIRLLYDFKTNRIVAAYQPSSGTISDDLEIHADVMFMREHQEDIEQITFASGKSISEIENIYCGLRFNKWTLNNKERDYPHSTLDTLLSRYERDIFYVSFPYDVKLSDVIGFGTYGQHWIVEYYDGAGRAEKGFWKDSESFWKFVTPAMKDNFTLKAGTGYIVALDLDEMYYTDASHHSGIWDNTDEVELLFPGNISSISDKTVTYNIPSHQCNINRGTVEGNRTKKDSHWNVLGVPTFKNITGAESVDGGGSGAIRFANTALLDTLVNDLKFIYDGNLSDNSLTPKAVKGFEFKAMHSYIAQYCGDVTFKTSNATTPASVARRTYAEQPRDVDFRLEINKNGVMEDQTFVSLSNDENVSADFAFGEDLSKEFNRNRANIYTFIGTEWVAGNTMPMSEQTTVVPVGVKIATTGDYTFAIPDGTSGVGVTLVDLETGVRTNLALFGYNINLEAGEYNERFLLEISPIQHISEGVDEVNGEGLEANGVRKVLIDNVLYIIRDGKVFDAQGKRLH